MTLAGITKWLPRIKAWLRQLVVIGRKVSEVADQAEDVIDLVNPHNAPEKPNTTAPYYTPPKNDPPKGTETTGTR